MSSTGGSAAKLSWVGISRVSLVLLLVAGGVFLGAQTPSGEASDLESIPDLKWTDEPVAPVSIDLPQSVVEPAQVQVDLRYLALLSDQADRANSGRGSGFIALFHGKAFLFTNAHVVGACANPSATSLAGHQLELNPIWSANEADLVLFEQKNLPAEGLELLDKVESNVAIGDEVVVVGNSMGAGVATQVRGKVLGVGAKVLEIDAQFVGGNSGSPVIHVKTGKVIGIASYAQLRQANDFLTEDSEFHNKVRRFAYRLDNIKGWTKVPLAQFVGESANIRALEQRTESIRAICIDIATNNGQIREWAKHLKAENPVSSPVKAWQDTVSKGKRTATSQLVSEYARFTNGMISALRPNVDERRITIPWLRQRWGEIDKEREPMREFFEARRKKLSEYGR